MCPQIYTHPELKNVTVLGKSFLLPEVLLSRGQPGDVGDCGPGGAEGGRDHPLGTRDKTLLVGP